MWNLKKPNSKSENRMVVATGWKLGRVSQGVQSSSYQINKFWASDEDYS